MSNKIELSGIFSEGYGFVPKKLMKAVDISGNTKLILCYLLSYTGSGSSCFPQIKDMALNLNISKRTIIRCISEAIKQGYISKHQENRGDKLGKRNIYELLFMVSSSFASAKLARANTVVASAKTDISQVTPGNSNSNSVNNNNLNNNTLQAPSSGPAYLDLFNYWVSFTALVQHKKYTDDMGFSIKKALKLRPIEEIKQAIKNYAEIMGDKSGKYFWTHSWILTDFLSRGVKKFVDEAKPLEAYIQKTGKQGFKQTQKSPEEMKRINEEYINKFAPSRRTE